MLVGCAQQPGRQAALQGLGCVGCLALARTTPPAATSAALRAATPRPPKRAGPRWALMQLSCAQAHGACRQHKNMWQQQLPADHDLARNLR